jgi:hypothetical protein
MRRTSRSGSDSKAAARSPLQRQRTERFPFAAAAHGEVPTCNEWCTAPLAGAEVSASEVSVSQCYVEKFPADSVGTVCGAQRQSAFVAYWQCPTRRPTYLPLRRLRPKPAGLRCAKGSTR